MPPKRYKDLYLREDTYIRLQQLKVALGKRSLNDVIDELLKVFTVSTVNSPEIR
jgi:predicted CopG family antitoxin